ncbi:MAG: DUF4956 domain-containing protein [Proteobacteria bacterium]|jgi:hypothetical protein|nr:DUF4956 domain-containing protein [Pseudomonadota bacterium]
MTPETLVDYPMLVTFLDYFGAEQLMDLEAIVKLAMRLGIDFTATFIVIRVIYVRLYQWNEQVFTYWAFNIVTFSLCLMLRKVPMELGFALGLFAVFGILRYRTEPIRIRDLTYLFVVIGLGILNALANKSISVAEIIMFNAVIVTMTVVLELGGRRKRTESAIIQYDNPELLLPGNESKLADDLRTRTGLKVFRFEVATIDLLRDTARIRVFHHPDENLLGSKGRQAK